MKISKKLVPLLPVKFPTLNSSLFSRVFFRKLSIGHSLPIIVTWRRTGTWFAVSPAADKAY